MLPRPIFRKTALERLASPDQLDQLLTVSSPLNWLALSALLLLIAVAGVWSVTARLPVTVAGQGVVWSDAGEQAETVLFVSPQTASQIRTGMAAWVMLAADGPDARGRAGVVTDVGTLPAGPSRVLAVLGRADLVQLLAPDPLAVEVRVALAPTAGRAIAPGGTLANVSVTVGTRRPIDVVLPGAVHPPQSEGS